MAQVEWKEMCPDIRAAIVAERNDVEGVCLLKCHSRGSVTWWLILRKDSHYSYVPILTILKEKHLDKTSNFIVLFLASELLVSLFYRLENDCFIKLNIDRL